MRPASALLACVCACGPTTAPPQVATTPQTHHAEPLLPTFLNPDDVAPTSTARGDSAAPSATAEPVFQQAHRRAISDLAFDSSGRLLAAVSAEGAVSVIDVQSGLIRASRRAWIRTTNDRRVMWTPSGHQLIVASGQSFTEAGGIRIWDMRTGWWTSGPETRVFFHPQSATIHPDGERIFFVDRDPQDERSESDAVIAHLEGSSEQELRFGVSTHQATMSATGRSFASVVGEAESVLLQVIGSNQPPIEIESESGFAHMAFRPGGGALALLDNAGSVRIIDPLRGEEKAVLVAEDAVHMTWSPGGSHLVVFMSTEAFAFDIHGQRVGRFAWPEGPLMQLAVVGPGAQTLYAGALEGLLAIGRDQAEPVIHLADENLLNALVRVSDDGSSIALVREGNHIVILEPDGSVRHRIEGAGGEHSVWSVKWSPDSKSLATYGRAGVELWGIDGVSHMSCGGMGPVLFRSGRAFQLAPSAICDIAADSRQTLEGSLLTLNEQGVIAVDHEREIEVRALDAESGARIRKPAALRSQRCRFGPCLQLYSLDADGDRFAFASGGLRPDVQIQSITSGRARSLRRWRPPARNSQPRVVELSPDGTKLAVEWQTEADREVVLYDAARGSQRGRYPVEAEEHVRAFAFSPDSALLAVLGSGVRLISAQTGAEVASAAVEGVLDRVRFSADGSTLVGSRSGTVLTWGRDGSSRLSVNVPAQLSVSPTGESFAFCEGGRLTVLDAVRDRRSRLGPCTVEDEPVYSPDGNLIALRRGAFVEVYRVGSSSMLTLRTPRIASDSGLQSFPIAYDRRGHFQITRSVAALVQVRQTGSLASAELGPFQAGQSSSDLVSSFFEGG